MSPKWAAWWVNGWFAILFLAGVWELSGQVLDMLGYTMYPTLSRLIAWYIPLWVSVPLTILLGFIGAWHWWRVHEDEKLKLKKRTMADDEEWLNDPAVLDEIEKLITEDEDDAR
jgi:hypothetical protein